MRSEGRRTSSISPPQMLILLGDPFLLLHDLESLGLKRQVVAILEVRTDGATDPRLSQPSAQRKRGLHERTAA